MDVQEIKEYLPQRYPFLLVDRIVSMELGKSIVAYKNVFLIPKLRKYFAEFLQHHSLKRLNILY